MEKRYGLSRLWEAHLADGRHRPQIPILQVMRAAFLLFAQRMPSLNAIEEILRRRGGPLVGGRVPSADTVGYATARLAPQGPRAVLAATVHRMRRKKALRRRDPSIPWTVAVDGHEHFKSFCRNCPACQTRRVTTAAGERTQYFHQSAVASTVLTEPSVALDAELLAPAEGEVVAARRVVSRLIEEHPWIEVFTLDALYLEAPLLRQIVQAGRSAVVPLKDPTRELHQEVARLCAEVPPHLVRIDGVQVEAWDLRDLPAWEGMEGIPIRVVRTALRRTRRRRIAGKWVEEEEIQDWRWVVVGPARVLPVATIHRIGHGRWEIENRTFNEQDRFHGLDHCFKHDARAIVNLLLTLFLAVALSTLFFTRNVKQAELRRLTLSGCARLLLERPPPQGARSIWVCRGPP